MTGHPRGRSIFASQAQESAADPSDEPVPPPTGTPPSQKKKKKPKRVEDEADELGHDDLWDSEALGLPRETYKPRPGRKRSTMTSIHEDETAQREAAHEAVDLTEIDQAADAVGTTERESGPAAPPPTTAEPPVPKEPKKRGRKKKQPIVEVTQNDQPGEGTAVPAVDSLPRPVEVEEVIEKPKKKRGRPRKSDQTKTATTAVSVPPPPPEEPEELEAPEVAEHEEDPFDNENDSGDHDEEASEQEVRKSRSKKIVEKQTKRKKARKSAASAVDDEADPLGEPDVAPLTEVDANTGANASVPAAGGSVKSESAEGTGAAASEKTMVKAPGKETGAAATTKSSAAPQQQSKVPHRVGLSKRTRIAPLLKIIRK